MKHRTLRRRGIIASLLTALLIFAGSPMGANSAAASTYYPIDVTQACKYTYNTPDTWADFMGFGPFDWICRQTSYGFPVSVSISSLGGVDMQKYCTLTYPGSRAVIVEWNFWGWKCRR